MKNLEINQEQIEKYVLNQLSEPEKAAFQTKLLFDKGLQEEVKKVRQLQKVLVATKLEDGITKKQSSLWKWLLPTLGLGLIAAYFVFFQNPPLPMESNLNSAPTKEDIFIPIEEKATKKATETPEKSEKIKETPKEQPQKSIPKSSSNKPLIAANYDPNSLLEAELSANLRGDYEFDIASPLPAQKYQLENGKITWTLAGALETDKIPNEDFNLQVEIYTNKKADYENEHPYLQFPLALEKVSETNYKFNSSHQFETNLSLYYFLIRDEFSGTILKAGKFSTY